MSLSSTTSSTTDAKDYRYLVFIGRFQPFHFGHKTVIDEALKRADNVIMLIGSANLPRSLRNPFSVAERTAMIKGAYSEADAARIHCVDSMMRCIMTPVGSNMCKRACARSLTTCRPISG